MHKYLGDLGHERSNPYSRAHRPSRGPSPPPHARGDTWRSDQAAFVPVYSKYHSSPPSPLHSCFHRSAQQHHEPPTPRYVPRPASPQHIRNRTHVHVNITKRRVRFDIPPQSPPHNQHAHKPSYLDLRRPPTPARPPSRRPSHLDLKRAPAQTHPLRPPSSHPLKRQASYSNVRWKSPSPPLPPRTTHPTIHILTYALNKTPQTRHALAHLRNNLPPSTIHLYTISAFYYTPPPRNICLLYSGVSRITQDYVMRDPWAKKAVHNAVEDLLAFGRQERQKGRDAKEDVAVSVCCEFGTHRSVGVAEMIREEIERLDMGIKVRVVHIHRIKGKLDPY